MNTTDLIQHVEHFEKLRILVIGDVILDAYFKGKVDRISPEAPVPVLEVKSKEFRLGGAANVALNVQHLGAECIVCSVVGNDQPGKYFEEIMVSEGLKCDGILESNRRTTSIKTRLVSGFSQLLRLDEEDTTPLNTEDEERFTHSILERIDAWKPDAIIFEDYDKGCLTPTVIEAVIQKAKGANIPVTVDPKRRNFFSYAGATLFKPNLKELREGLNRETLKADSVELNDAFQALVERMEVKQGFFTLSEHGVFITDGVQWHHIQAVKRNITDVSGAGDTVIATASCALASGLDMKNIALLSNLAGGWVCQYPGVVSISKEELQAELSKLAAHGH